MNNTDKDKINKNDIHMVRIPLKTESEFLEKDHSLLIYLGVILVIGTLCALLIG